MSYGGYCPPLPLLPPPGIPPLTQPSSEMQALFESRNHYLMEIALNLWPADCTSFNGSLFITGVISCCIVVLELTATEFRPPNFDENKKYGVLFEV